ncbi:MAG: hypothetical protein IJX56_00390, partial [Alistipes sp.]|nr:hypothetical protein [Alistipes sp.]
MKKNYLVLGLMTMILGLTACTKEAIDNAVAAPEQEQMITHTFSISDEAWDDEVRSSYTPGTGIQLTGTEAVTFYYSVASDAYDASTPYTFKSYAEGTNSGDFQISVSHSAVDGAEAYDYYFMMPYLPTSKMNGSGATSYHRIGHVQYPSASSFDPNFDYLVGKPVLNVSATADSDNKISGTNKIAGFKRITTPLHLTITDGAGALAEEKIQQVTLSFDAATSKKGNKCLTGLFYYRHSSNYSDCDFTGWEAGSLSNAVTADYPAGLTKNSEGKWDVWFMVNPTTIPA